jgi:hypothetical protein
MSLPLLFAGILLACAVLTTSCEIQKDAGANVIPLEMNKSVLTERKAAAPMKSSHTLHVSRDKWGGWIVSAPAGINYGDPSNGSISEARYPEGTEVKLCVSSTHSIPFIIAWTGDCSGTTRCIDVLMDSDKNCNLALTPI